MSETYVTSDLHLGHVNIVGFCDRPWNNADEMNEGLIDLWNETVNPGDTVWVVGDFALGKIADTLPLAKLLNGDKHLIPGNHDRCWPYHKKVGDWAAKYAEVGFTVHDVIVQFQPNLIACHFPYAGDSHDVDRYKSARPQDNGQFLLHGHTHSSHIVSGHPRQIHVGIDAWDYRPVALDTLLEYVK